MEMQDRVVVVTGAFGALGAAVARAFAARGARLALLDFAQPPAALQRKSVPGTCCIGGVDLSDVEAPAGGGGRRPCVSAASTCW